MRPEHDAISTACQVQRAARGAAVQSHKGDEVRRARHGSLPRAPGPGFPVAVTCDAAAVYEHGRSVAKAHFVACANATVAGLS